MDTFLSIALVGAGLSLAMNWIKAKWGTTSVGSRAIVIILSLAIGGVFYFLKDTAFWQSAIGVLASASTVYAVLLKK